jgi:hypothetical protein
MVIARAFLFYRCAMDLREIYSCVVSGMSLTDVQVVEGAREFRKLADKLFSIGPEFRITGIECNRVATLLDDFRVSRGLKEKK